ncbi:MAG: hypothetical protein K0S67_15 [Nitrososphaeraceae archaeon]|jgi:uncharacterized coiled-coil protein SlyX|nr:hypothetical protein [Nitrososphaeraceae archaeon]
MSLVINDYEEKKELEDKIKELEDKINQLEDLISKQKNTINWLADIDVKNQRIYTKEINSLQYKLNNINDKYKYKDYTHILHD